jgi:hypothetical protein
MTKLVSCEFWITAACSLDPRFRRTTPFINDDLRVEGGKHLDSRWPLHPLLYAFIAQEVFGRLLLRKFNVPMRKPLDPWVTMHAQ